MNKLCNNEEMLADYLEGRLSDIKISRMEEHLSDCEVCSEELIIGKDLIRGGSQPKSADVPDEVTEAAVRLVNNLTTTNSNSLKERFNRFLDRFFAMLTDLFNVSTWGERCLSPVRSSKIVVSKELVRLKKSFNEIDVEIEIEKTGEGNSCIRVNLLNNMKAIKGVRVTLLQGKEREIASHLLNGDNVVFEDTPFGHYGLVFFRDGLKLGICRFVIKETRYGRR